MSKVLITGATGQDASYMAELCLYEGDEVHMTMRRSSTICTERINHLLYPEEKIKTYYNDLADGLDGLIYDIKPDVIINLAAQSHVRVSFDQPVYTVETNALGPLKILEAIRRIDPKIRFYQASSSEMFGLYPPPQNENTPMWPSSPYGAAKLAAYHMVKQYRLGYGIHASNGILFNHESPRRGKTFVTAKIVFGAVRIAMGLSDSLTLGNLDAKRDWGHSADYMRAIYAIINHDTPGDWCVASKDQHSVKEFVITVFNQLGLDWEKYVKYSDKYTRPVEVPSLLGDATKIKEEIGWEPKISFESLVKSMIENAKDEITFGKFHPDKIDWAALGE